MFALKRRRVPEYPTQLGDSMSDTSWAVLQGACQRQAVVETDQVLRLELWSDERLQISLASAASPRLVTCDIVRAPSSTTRELPERSEYQ